jgi:bifunctional DNA primase/polymerase-like protein
MQTKSEFAQDALRRGLKVFLLKPRSKDPDGRLAPHGCCSATSDRRLAEGWWRVSPEGNIGVTGDVIVDVDQNVQNIEQLREFMRRNGLTETFAIRTGRRPGFGVQLHYHGTAENWKYEQDGVRGEIRCRNQYGLYAGSIHPISGAQYVILIDAPIAAWPEGVKLGKTRREFRASAPNASETPTNTLAARETFERLLAEAKSAKPGGRNYAAHSLAWFGARGFLAGIFEESEKELKQQILTVVTRLYASGERDVHKMLSDSWRYGLSAKRLLLDLYFSDLDQIFRIADPSDETTWRLLSGNTADFPSAIRARDEFLELLSVAGFGAEGQKRLLSYSGLDLLAAQQMEAELELEAFLKG